MNLQRKPRPELVPDGCVGVEVEEVEVADRHRYFHRFTGTAGAARVETGHRTAKGRTGLQNPT